MPVITVDGPIAADELGPTLSHEHVFIDTSPDYREPPTHIASLIADLGVDLEAPITLKSLGFLRREPQWSVSNQIVESYDDAVEELGWARRVGIKSIFDLTPIMAGRQPAALRRLSRELGMHIVTGTGYYREAFQPPDVDALSVDELEERFLSEVTRGDGRHGRTGRPPGRARHDRGRDPAVEERVLIAAARVQRRRACR